MPIAFDFALQERMRLHDLIDGGAQDSLRWSRRQDGSAHMIHLGKDDIGNRTILAREHEIFLRSQLTTLFRGLGILGCRSL
jgi:hypothetical protein